MWNIFNSLTQLAIKYSPLMIVTSGPRFVLQTDWFGYYFNYNCFITECRSLPQDILLDYCLNNKIYKLHFCRLPLISSNRYNQYEITVHIDQFGDYSLLLWPINCIAAALCIIFSCYAINHLGKPYSCISTGPIIHWNAPCRSYFRSSYLSLRNMKFVTQN